VLRRLWVVERTLDWLMRYRRLARHNELTTASAEAMFYPAAVLIMTGRLARYEQAGPDQATGGERPSPAEQAAFSTGSYRGPTAAARG